MFKRKHGLHQMGKAERKYTFKLRYGPVSWAEMNNKKKSHISHSDADYLQCGEWINEFLPQIERI